MNSMEKNETVYVSNNQMVKVVKPLIIGYTQDPDSAYIVETGDNQIEVYEVETIKDQCEINIGNHDVMVSDNASCWLWGSVDDPDVALEHCELLRSAGIDPMDLIEMIEDCDLRAYVRDAVELAKKATREEA